MVGLNCTMDHSKQKSYTFRDGVTRASLSLRHDPGKNGNLHRRKNVEIPDARSLLALVRQPMRSAPPNTTDETPWQWGLSSRRRVS
jgi:hypothetical protein